MEDDLSEKVLPIMTCPVCNAVEHAFFCTKDGYKIFRCRACALLFVHPVPSLTDLYDTSYFGDERDSSSYVDYDEDKKAMVPVFSHYLTLLRENLRGSNRLLDIGAATGFFVEQASRALFQAEGVEISEAICLRAQRQGRNVYQGTVGSFDSEMLAKQFDVITMWDLIEHLPDLATAMSDVKHLLPVGGLLFVNTPDAGSLWARMFATKWHSLVPPEHLLWFNKKNLAFFLERHGFEILHVSTTYKSFTFQYIVNMLYRWQRLSVWAWLRNQIQGTWLGRLRIPIPLGDNLTIIGRRKV